MKMEAAAYMSIKVMVDVNRMQKLSEHKTALQSNRRRIQIYGGHISASQADTAI